MKYLFFIFLLAGSGTYAQHSTSFYQKIIKKGFCDENTVSCINHQYAYFDACDKLGDYFFAKEQYRKAIKYYSLPLQYNAHSSTIFTDSSYKLRNKAIAKAGDMIFNGIGVKKDTINFFNYHYQYPLNYEMEERKIYSTMYFGTLKDINIIPVPDTMKNVSMLIGVSPFMLTEEQVLQQISALIIKNVNNKKNVNITLNKSRLLSLSEANMGILYTSAEKLKKIILISYPALFISTDVEIDDFMLYALFNGKTIPTFIIEIK